MPGFIDSQKLKKLILAWPDFAIEYLYEHYYSSLVHIAERKTNNRKVSEDIVQEAFTELWKKAEWVGKTEGLLVVPYLAGIIKNKAITYYRQHVQPDNGRPQPAEEIRDMSDTIESEIIQGDEHIALRNLITTLPPRERACIEMRFFQEMSIEAIAIRLGVTKKAIEKNITSALKRLRKGRSSVG